MPPATIPRYLSGASGCSWALLASAGGWSAFQEPLKRCCTNAVGSSGLPLPECAWPDPKALIGSISTVKKLENQPLPFSKIRFPKPRNICAGLRLLERRLHIQNDGSEKEAGLRGYVPSSTSLDSVIPVMFCHVKFVPVESARPSMMASVNNAGPVVLRTSS